MSEAEGEVALGLQQPFLRLKAAFQTETYPDFDVRIERLKRLENALLKYAQRLIAAMSADFGHRSPVESDNFDIIVPLGEIRSIRRHLKRWMAHRKVPVPKHLWPASASIVPQPLGVIGIISPWNFPVNLSVLPLAAALAAGNRVMLKPSELTPQTSLVLKEMIESIFTHDEVYVALGDATVAAEFSSLPFDHLLFTGSTAVGYKVYEAASKNLTPVTLELGGKSPAIVTPSADLDRAARRVTWGKLANAGQICIAPDYALVPEAALEEFIEAVQKSAHQLYTGRPGAEDYTSIINERQFVRLENLVSEAENSGAKIVTLGAFSAINGARQFKPKLVINPPLDGALMKDEIFGPILPIITYRDMSEAVELVQAREHPLALYVFATQPADSDIWVRDVLAGGMCINDTLMHVASDTLPFGGVGKSGIGAYHGQAGFDRFSHLKSVFKQARLNGSFLFEPPFTGWKKTVLSLLRRFI